MCSLLSHESLSENAYTLVAELAGSVQSLTKSATEELHVFGEVEKAHLPSTTSHGLPVFRVLQALSSLVVLLNDKDKNNKILPEEEQVAAISMVGDINVTLEPLWQELSNCISKIESHSDTFSEQSPSTSVTVISKPQGVMPSLPAGAQNILPNIESFFVTCEKLHPGQSGSGHDFGINAVSDVEKAAASVCHQLRMRSAQDLKGRLTVHFQGEEGIDAGGTSKVPLEGFSALQGISGCQKFQIHKAYVSGNHLPSAHTCFNQLDLPEYPSKQHLEERLLVAIHEGNEGFGFG
ncbi:E3 ubiquitin- ligase UPL2-like [Olea europaea subsp. europaea]|uniref:HECT-type E3 ubiquitin transferase n=1 Tax=Olea europaea subsp. europaea TaxID=158383 RepID=A0A8S0Q0Z2_OLEEU|nr:E3 ubiquitin- ligase UPL2-like [Olea europaea subsp. europaea]